MSPPLHITPAAPAPNVAPSLAPSPTPRQQRVGEGRILSLRRSDELVSLYCRRICRVVSSFCSLLRGRRPRRNERPPLREIYRCVSRGPRR